MSESRKELAASLDAEEALLPFMSALLQDLWSLGVSPEPALAILGQDEYWAKMPLRVPAVHGSKNQ